MRFLPHMDKGGAYEPRRKKENSMIINCTPHDVAIYNISDLILNNGRLYLHEKAGMEYPEPLRVYPAAKVPTRVTVVQEPAGIADGTLIYRWFPEEIINLPKPKPDTYYIVSTMVAQAWPAREDFISPGTLVHDADGHIVGCIDFSRV